MPSGGECGASTLRRIGAVVVVPLWSAIDRVVVDDETTVLTDGFNRVRSHVAPTLGTGVSWTALDVLVETMIVDVARRHQSHLLEATSMQRAPHPSGGDKLSSGRRIAGLGVDVRASMWDEPATGVGGSGGDAFRRPRETVSAIVSVRPWVAIADDGDVVDFKTDLHRHAESEYQKQLSVYYHVVSALYPEREVTTSLFYTADGERQEIDPLDKAALRKLVREASEGLSD